MKPLLRLLRRTDRRTLRRLERAGLDRPTARALIHARADLQRAAASLEAAEGAALRLLPVGWSLTATGGRVYLRRPTRELVEL